MIPEQRRAALMNEIRVKKLVSVQELTEILKVSHMTVRRDINVLEAEGRVLAVPGGAKLVPHVAVEPSRIAKTVLQLPQKRAIARAAAEMVGTEEMIYVDAGTTTQEMIPLLADRTDITIVTNDFGVVDSLAATQIPTVHIGGQVDHANRSTVGTLATLVLAELNLNVAFLSAPSWSLRRGVTTPSLAKVDVKQAVMSNASRRVLLVDSSKYGSFSAHNVAPLSSFDTIVSDDGLSPSVADAIRDLGVQVVLASDLTSR